jgi:hypothetical protein
MFDEAYLALRQFIDANWTATARIWKDEDTDPPSGNPFLRLQIDAVPASSASLFGSVGKRVANDPGIIIASLYMPTGSGEERGYKLARQFGDLLRVKKIGPAVTEAPSTNPVEDGDEDGRWERYDVTIPFTASYFA